MDLHDSMILSELLMCMICIFLGLICDILCVCCSHNMYRCMN